MRISVKGKNGNLPDALKQYAEKKVQKLERYFGEIHSVEVAQTTERGQHIVELNVEGDGVFLRSQERCNDLYAAVDNVVDKMERQVKRFKTRRQTSRRHPGPVKEIAAARASAVEAEPEVEEFQPRIVRRKRFPMKPMSSAEAARQMELVDHDFFLFLNEETGDVNVLYRRQDGHYGLIEPET